VFGRCATWNLSPQEVGRVRDRTAILHPVPTLDVPRRAARRVAAPRRQRVRHRRATISRATDLDDRSGYVDDRPEPDHQRRQRHGDHHHDRCRATTSATSSTATPANQEIVDAYTAYWDARFAANSGTPNPEDPALVAHASGAQLEAVIAETQRNLDDGVAFQASPVPADYRRVTVISVDGDRAEVQECFVDDVQVVDRTTGQIVNDVVATQSVSGTLRLVDGTWRVSGSDLVQRWEGVAGCALAS